MQSVRILDCQVHPYVLENTNALSQMWETDVRVLFKTYIVLCLYLVSFLFLKNTFCSDVLASYRTNFINLIHGLC